MSTNQSQSQTSRRLTAPQWLYQELRARIIRGELRAGDALRQQHVASEFGTSAIPVREALRMLEADRFVVIHPNRGAVVRTISLAEAEEIVKIRLVVEPLAISMAVPNMTETNVRAARQILESFAGVEDPLELSGLNREFHFSLYQPCGSPRLLAIIESLFDDVLRFAHVNIAYQHGNKQAHREHRSIWVSCRNGQPQQAADRLHAHIERSRNSLAKLLAR